GLPSVDELNLGLGIEAITQTAIGMGLGFVTIVFFQLFVVAGQFIAMQMGLGFASMVDPTNGVTVTVLSQFFLMMVSLTFVAMNGHLVLLDVLIEGFKRVPVGIEGSMAETAWEMASLGGWMFSGGVLIALPAVTSLLVVNLSFGVMSRAAPQLNVFSLGFPFALVFGLGIIWISLYGFAPQFEALSQSFFSFTRRWA
ncbi:MAG: flagellar biosynthetic protein FliR, partial [Gammaproteobacteria bacterium]|nr:flagellar biosynthetic protein FliR [Gammaproteobacteria bacterium]